MKQFDKGWWNCFLSYTDEKKEIEGILKTEIMSDKTRELLTEYKDNLK